MAPLRPISRIAIKAEDGEIFYFCLPSQSQQRNMPQVQTQVNKQIVIPGNVQKPVVNIGGGSKWSNDDH